MQTSEFDYDLPEASIAQVPAEPRDAARLLVLHRRSRRLEHRIFSEIGEYLAPGDLLVLNQTRVLPARLFARKETGGQVEILLLRRRQPLVWEALVRGRGLRVGRKLQVEGGPTAEIAGESEGPQRLIRFEVPLEPFLPRIGHVPLPPYIHQPLKDPQRYQTVYARRPGSVAAPTAGLHFTPRLLHELQERGIEMAYVTLHIGLDTFAPVTEEDPRAHKIHTEWCELPQETADALRRTRERGGRVIAVGTTSVRVLETAAARASESPARVAAFADFTDLFILPGHSFRLVDAMITNFHLPRSTLLMLVSAFAGRERILEAYRIAVEHGYRFYSFGDAMLIL